MEHSFANQSSSSPISNLNLSNLPPGISLHNNNNIQGSSQGRAGLSSFLLRANQSPNPFLSHQQSTSFAQAQATLDHLSQLQRRRFSQQQPFTFSPDPPASGPPLSSMPPHHRSRASASANVSSSPRPRTRRTAFPRSAPAAASTSASPALSSVPSRRSSRSRKRPGDSPAAAAASATTQTQEESRDPPTKRRRVNLKKPPPASLKGDNSEDGKKPAADEKDPSCCICMDEPKPADLAQISGCDHFFCFDCIEKWAERENSCPLCKNRFTKIERVHKAKRKAGERAKNSKKVKQKDQRSDLAPGAALEGLLASFASTANFPPHRVARLIFSGMGAQSPFILSSNNLRRGGQRNAPARAGVDNSVYPTRGIDNSDSDEDEEDESSFLPGGDFQRSSFSDLFRAIPLSRGGPGIIVGGGNLPGGIGSFRPLNGPLFDPPAGRSYASNGNDQNAGRQAENPLEIDDDSDEDDVEVVQVTRPL